MISRRRFLQTAAAGAVGLEAQLGSMTFAQEQDASGGTSPASGNQVVVVAFLRGGADFLNMITPVGGADRGHYEAARSDVRIDAGELLELGEVDGTGLGLHPAMARLQELFDDDRLAVVLGAGLTTDNRSHFDAQRFIEYGAVDNTGLRSGWLARLLATNGANGLFPAAALSSNAPDAFATSNQVVALPSVTGFDFPRNFGRWQSAQRSAVRAMYGADTTIAHQAGLQALAGSNVLELNASNEYSPANGVEYQGEGFSRAMSSIAQLIKLDIGLSTVTVDLGGWDTHSNQGNGSGGVFSQLAGAVADGLSDFYADLDDAERTINRVSVIVMSEFGRRVQQNASAGTDHGRGGAMFVLGGNVNGGFHGTWPSLAPDNRFQGADMEVTTDYRRVLSDIAIRQFANNRLGALFPGYTDHEPMGLVPGDDLEPDYSEPDPEELVAPVLGEGDVDGGTGAINEDGSIGSDDNTRVALIGGGVGLGVGVAATAGLSALARRRKRVSAAQQPTPSLNEGK